MNKIITILILLLPLSLFAETTTDRLVLTADANLKPGGTEVKVTISLEGSRIYTGYEMDITLPEGVELNYYNGNPDVSLYKAEGTIYPYIEDRDGNKEFSHSVTTTYGEVAERTIRIACLSTKSENFSSTSGKILTLYLKASATAQVGEVALALNNCKFATFDENTMQTTGYVPEQTTLTGITISNQSTDIMSASDTINASTNSYNLAGMAVGKMHTGTIYINNGKKIIR